MIPHKKLRDVCVYASKDRWIMARGYTLYALDPATGKKEYFAQLADKKNALLSRFRLTRRLFRAEITHLYHFENNVWMCIAKKALFRYNAATKRFEKCHVIEKGSRPMNLCQSKEGTIYYGEYCYNPDCAPMRIFQSKDGGSTWSVAYTFEHGAVNHIHGLFADPFSNKLWVATGDADHACIFGYTEDGFKTFVKAYQGTQQCRVCVPLFLKDTIVFATDSQYEQNYIRAIDRATGQISDLQAIQGSGIYAVPCGGGYMVSTTVEPSKVNTDRYSHLWYSANGTAWRELLAYKKDLLPMAYFQFGSLRFPTYDGETEHLIVTGRALCGANGKTIVINMQHLPNVE